MNGHRCAAVDTSSRRSGFAVTTDGDLIEKLTEIGAHAAAAAPRCSPVVGERGDRASHTTQRKIAFSEKAGAALTRHQELPLPLALNQHFRVTADDMQWIVQKRRERGTWEGVIYAQTLADLVANMGFEVFGVGESRSRGLYQAEIGTGGGL